MYHSSNTHLSNAPHLNMLNNENQNAVNILIMQDPVASVPSIIATHHPCQPTRKTLHASSKQVIRALELDKTLISILTLTQTHTLPSRCALLVAIR
jgi:hypothetical protein